MFKQIIQVISAIAGLCVTMDSHPRGALNIIALTAILAIVYVLYWLKN